MVEFKDLFLNDSSIPEVRRTDKNGRFYHIIQRASSRDNIYDAEIAKYRENTLCRLCAMHNVVIIFSVVMTNHTHDVLMGENLDSISNVIRLVNSAVSRRLRKRSPQRYTNGRKVFESDPYYRAIHDIVSLTIVGKYTYDNVMDIKLKNGFVPYSCFSFLEKGTVIKPYNKNLYPSLFGMSEQELCNLYKANDMHAVRQIALNLYKNWTLEDNDRIFKANINIPWLD